MIDEKIQKSLEFSSEMRSYLDVNFDKWFSETITTPDIDISDDEGDIVDLEQEDNNVNVVVNDKKVKNKIASALLDDKIQNQLFLIEYNISKNTLVEGYS